MVGLVALCWFMLTTFGIFLQVRTTVKLGIPAINHQHPPLPKPRYTTKKRHFQRCFDFTNRNTQKTDTSPQRCQTWNTLFPFEMLPIFRWHVGFGGVHMKCQNLLWANLSQQNLNLGDVQSWFCWKSAIFTQKKKPWHQSSCFLIECLPKMLGMSEFCRLLPEKWSQEEKVAEKVAS